MWVNLVTSALCLLFMGLKTGLFSEMEANEILVGKGSTIPYRELRNTLRKHLIYLFGKCHGRSLREFRLLSLLINMFVEFVVCWPN